MRNAVSNAAGHIELTTGDPARAKDFYSKLFGWSFQDNPMPGGVPGAGAFSIIADPTGAAIGMWSSEPQ